MAAEQKAVESTVEEILQREEHLVATESHSEKENHLEKDLSVRDLREEALVRVVREDHHSVRERASVTDHADLSVRAMKDAHSVRDRREELSAKELKEDHSATESHLARESHLVTESRLVKEQKEEASVRVVKEDHQETSATESQVDSE